uniref:Uncharacterized protein n=1 Tax=Anas platyrhynchos TaxID=8839 RepID=A0A8B9ZHS7_ANAPL
ISTVPVRAGLPPSIAVSTRRCSANDSRSRPFVSTRNSDSRCSSLRCKSRAKCSLGLRV